MQQALERWTGKPFDPAILDELGVLSVVVTVDPLGPDSEAAVAILKTLLPQHQDAAAAWSVLVQIAGTLMRSRGSVDEVRLRALLEGAGIDLSARRPDASEVIQSILKRFGPILILPSVLSVAASLQSLYTFTKAVAEVLRHWTEFEIALWTALLGPLIRWLDLGLQSQLFRGLTIPVFWTLIALRLHFSRREQVKTVSTVVAQRWPRFPVWLALIGAVYLPACFYIALNLQGMFDGYLAPGPLMLVKDTFPVIVGYLGLLTGAYIGWGRLKRYAGARPPFPVFLYSAYLALLVLFYLDDRFQWGSKKGVHAFL